MPSRERLGTWIESGPMQRIIIAVIVINAVTLGLETSDVLMAQWGGLLQALDRAALAVFVVEIGLKLYAFGLRFFRSAWNLFDFTVVAIALVPASGPLAVLRALRVLRVLRLVSSVPRLRFVVEALLAAVPGITSIAGLMLLLFYIFAVMSTSLFGERFPEWFGNIGASMYTLFQIMTLESWSEAIVRPVMEVFPYAWLFFIPFIVITAFAVLNLFMALIVDSMQKLHEAEWQEERAELEEVGARERAAIETEIASLREEVAGLRRDLAAGGRPEERS